MSITLILAPMFSGKTTYLVSQASISYDLGFEPIFVTHSLETRNDSVFLHSSVITPNFENKIRVVKTSSLKQIKNLLDQYTHIFIDEFQFFQDEDDLGIIKLLADSKHMYVAGLKSDSNNNKFGMLLDLIPIADDIVYLKSSCILCAKRGTRVQASFTKKTIEDQSTVKVGAAESYIPVCRKHYYDSTLF